MIGILNMPSMSTFTRHVLRSAFLITLMTAGLLGLYQPVRALPNDKSGVGSNLHEIAYWSPEWPFVDVFKTARPWVPQKTGAGWGQGDPLSLDENGWITALKADQWAETMVFQGHNHYPAGQYVFLYDGSGEFEFYGAKVADQAQGRITLDVTPTEGIGIKLVKTDPKDYVHNIRLIMPGFESTYETQPFHPLFLQRLERYRVLRFMDWMHTNNSPVVHWADRTRADYYTQGDERGVAPEWIIKLGNTLHADIWINIPHRAADDYVEGLATLIRDQLAPDLKVYIEYSNETWNGAFEQAQYVMEQGEALKLSSDRFQAGLFFHSRRAVQSFAIFEKIFGGTTRLVRVLAAQAANSWTGEQVMDFESASQHADALAIAPYFCNELGDPATQDKIASTSVKAILDECKQQITTTVAEWIKFNKAATDQRKLQLVAYEGGQHLAGYGGAQDNDKLTEKFLAVNRDMGIKDLYLLYLKQWKQSGAGVFVNFTSVASYSKYGSWGVLEYQDQDVATAPKYQAIMAFLE